MQRFARPVLCFYPPEWSNFEEGVVGSKMPPTGNSQCLDRVLCD